MANLLFDIPMNNIKTTQAGTTPTQVEHQLKIIKDPTTMAQYPEDDINRLIIKVTRDTLPQIKDKYPFLYLERGRLEIDDSSVKWIDNQCNVIRLPIATIHAILLGPGTSVTHEAIKILAAANCTVNWVGEDSLLFYAHGITPTADTRRTLRQIHLATNPQKALQIAKNMFAQRFPNTDLTNTTLQDLRTMEGQRVKDIYRQKAKQYNIKWKGREYTPGDMAKSDITNQILTAANTALYALVNSAILSLGYSPHIGFVHSGSPLPFTYDIADLYKEQCTIDLAFRLTMEMAGIYNRHRVAENFIDRVKELNLLAQIPKDIATILGEPAQCSS